MSAITHPLDRRSFLKTGLAGATGLVIGFYLPGKREVLRSRLRQCAAGHERLHPDHAG